MDKSKFQEFVFGEFRLDVRGHQLWCRKNPVKLTPKAFETLVLLIEKQGELVTKDELLDKIWKDTFVEEGSLTRNISVLRKVFAPNEFIKTIPRKGYSFNASVKNNRPQRETASKEDISLAVLPFKFLTNIEEDFFGLGLTDALITRLCNLREIEVRPTNSVIAFVETTENYRSIGEKLRVKLLLDGKIQHFKEDLRVTFQLIEAEKEKVILADKVDVKYKDLLSLQDSISRDVAKVLMPKLSKFDQRRFEKSFTSNNFAYQNYLKGRYFWNKRNVESFYKAIEFFKEAIDEDPLFGLAYAGIADCYNMLSNYGVLRPHEAFPKAKAASEKALEIDNEIAEAHASLAYVLRSYDWDYEHAEKEFKLALKFNPNYASAHQWYASMLIALERFDEAINELETAQRLDPLSLAINASFGFASFYLRDFDRLIEENLKILEMEKNFIPLHYGLSLAYIEKQMFEEAISEMKGIVETDTENQRWLAHLGSAYAASGKNTEAKKILKNLIAKSKKEYISPLDISMIFLRLGERDSAFQWLDKSIQEREANLIFLRVDPEFDSLRSDSRFKKILKNINLA